MCFLLSSDADKTSEPVPVRSPLLSFVEHYDISTVPRPRPTDPTRAPLPTIAAKSILQRVANITGTERSHQESRRPPPSIASALMSVAVDSSAPLVKNMNKSAAGRGLSGLGGALAIGLGGMVPGATGPPGHQTMMADRKNHLSELGTAETSDVIAADVSAVLPLTASDRLSAAEALASNRIDDHFDQYQTWSRHPPPSSVSSRSSRHVVRPRNPFGPPEEDPELATVAQGAGSSAAAADGGLSGAQRPSSAASRRQTLTGGGHGAAVPLPPPPPPPPRQTSSFNRSQAPSRGPGVQRISENGDLRTSSGARNSTAEGPGFLRAPLRPVSTGMRRATGKRGSMPDVSEGSFGGGGGVRGEMPREEVHLMSLRRREEIRREREAEARRRQEQVVLSFSEFKVNDGQTY